MKYRTLGPALVTASLLALSAPSAYAAGSDMPVPGPTTDVPPTPGATAGQPGGAGSAGLQQVDTKTYVQNAAMTDLFEVQAGKLALQKSQNASVKKFAKQMVKDHTRTTKHLQAALKKGDVDVTPPTELDATHAQLLQQLQNASGADFDKTYIQQQLQGHQEALRLHQGYAASGDNAMLKKLAAKTAQIVQHHLNEVKGLDTATTNG